jgi:hypothetical protein
VKSILALLLVACGSPSGFILERGVSDDFEIARGASLDVNAIAAGYNDTELVALTVIGAPAGVTVTLDPTVVAAGRSFTMHIVVDASAAAATSHLRVSGEGAKGGTEFQEYQFDVTVK